ncbi:hypothetical protein [uncultured Clostridium sp.]|uniref:hypothetical protein n=1 Tax=uncultured Clostridium sp. TaxID=59620 RepID=UPI0028E4C3AF|nr:hypothetical protein [uncultured Clostridium sp.]
MEENRVERRLVMRVEEIRGKAYKWNPLGVKGVQDRIVLLPDGRTIFVELKAPGEKPRKLQKI